MAEREARVPPLDALGLVAIEGAHVLDGSAETGGAHQRAVRAGQAALRDIVPTWVLQVGDQHVARTYGVEPPCHPLDASGDDVAHGPDIVVGRGSPRHDRLELGQHLGTALRSDLDHQLVAGTVEQFGHGEVVAGPDRRTGAHRRAEAGRGRAAAVDAHEERSLPGLDVRRVGMRSIPQHPVLDGDRRQLARLQPDEGVGGWLDHVVDELEPVADPHGRPQRPRWRRQEASRRRRPDRVREEGSVVAAT